MVTVLEILVFAPACGLSLYAIGAAIVPQFDRIVGALAGRSQLQFAPLTDAARAERRVAIRRWAATARARQAVPRAAA